MSHLRRLALLAAFIIPIERHCLAASADRPDQDTWNRFQPVGVYLPERKRLSTVTAWASHNYLALALDREGLLHLSGNMHNDPLVYYPITRPFDVTSLERLDRMTGQRENETTSPLFFKNAAGELLFRYRDGGSGRGSGIYNRYDPAALRLHEVPDTTPVATSARVGS